MPPCFPHSLAAFAFVVKHYLLISKDYHRFHADRSRWFQFQTGAIKSLAEDISYETSTFCFNSKLVRLKVDYLGHLAFCGSDMFQFQTGAIKRKHQVSQIAVSTYVFQFQTGAIKR